MMLQVGTQAVKLNKKEMRREAANIYNDYILFLKLNKWKDSSLSQYICSLLLRQIITALQDSQQKKKQRRGST